jgi:hypothetical protein
MKFPVHSLYPYAVLVCASLHDAQESPLCLIVVEPYHHIQQHKQQVLNTVMGVHETYIECFIYLQYSQLPPTPQNIQIAKVTGRM